MIDARIHARRSLGAIAAVWAVWQAGCVSTPPSTRSASPYHRTVTIAVAPALNQSGSSEFDPLIVADLFASELSQVDEVVVIPVSRTLAVLASQGRQEIESPAHALEVCEALGAEAIIVMAITEYDPYDPPVIGMAAQLYAPAQTPGSRLDPVAVSRRPSPFAVETPERSELLPRSQSQRVFNAAHETVATEVRRYARDRDADDSPYGWRKWIKSQQLFLRFCCWATVESLMEQELARQSSSTES